MNHHVVVHIWASPRPLDANECIWVCVLEAERPLGAEQPRSARDAPGSETPVHWYCYTNLTELWALATAAQKPPKEADKLSSRQEPGITIVSSPRLSRCASLGVKKHTHVGVDARYIYLAARAWCSKIMANERRTSRARRSRRPPSSACPLTPIA